MGDRYKELDQGQRQTYYRENGYLVARGLIPAGLCDRARLAFTREIKPYGGFLYRQASANPERNQFTPEGFVLNSLLNLQDLSRSWFPGLKQAGLEVLTHPALAQELANLLGQPPLMVQSMYFEGNPATWAHQDCYYLDSTDRGELIGVWIALEDIQPGAGRFYVYPKSHTIDLAQNGGDFDVAFHHDRYKQLVLEIVRSHDLECRAPALAKGDVLFWSSRTIHGSLTTTAPEHSRNSITGHYVSVQERLLQWEKRVVPLKLRTVAGVPVHCPKDQDRVRNRLKLAVETRFPKTFQTAKKLATKLLVR